MATIECEISAVDIYHALMADPELLVDFWREVQEDPCRDLLDAQRLRQRLSDGDRMDLAESLQAMAYQLLYGERPHD